MKMRYLQILLGLFCLLATSFSYAKVYKWVDDSGTIHLTDDSAKVPERYWERVEEIKTSKEEGQKPSDEGKRPKRRVQREPTDRFGRRESWWRDRASKWWVQLENATAEHRRITKEIEETEKVLDKARNDGKRRRYRRQIKRLRKEDEKYKAQIDEAKHMLNDVLLDEARIADADSSWLRPIP
jgi:TATA-binding protein-associated factor Taf7